MDIQVLKRKGLSQRRIAAKLGISRNTVKKYIRNPYPEQSQERKTKPGKLTPYIPNINQWLNEDQGYTATWIYDQLKSFGYNGSYDMVKIKVREFKKVLQLKAYIAFETEPGRQAQVDFGEFQVEDPSGQVTKYYIFSMILGYSRRLYAELIRSCDMPNFLDCHKRAFAFFEGVPQEILYDRMRNVFIRKIAGKDEFNKTLVGFALHYGFKPMVAPAYAPWVKGKVERPFSFIRENFWRGYSFIDLKTANADLHAWLLEKEQRIHGTTQEKVSDRFKRESPKLIPVPLVEFDTSWRLYRQVRKDCTIQYDRNRYVVSHKLVGKKVLVRVKDKSLRIFMDNKLHVTYVIPDGKGKLVQDSRFYKELRRDRLLNQRKYLSFYPKKGRAKKTISIKKMIHEMDVFYRPLTEYQKVAEG